MNIFESQAGHDFITRLMPRLVVAVEKIAAGPSSSRRIPLEKLPIYGGEQVLNDLYEGFFCPGEQSGVSHSERYRNLTATLHELSEELEGQLTKEQWSIIEKYCTIMSERDGDELNACFTSGFRAATQLIFAGLDLPEDEDDEV